jgi:hypothetical protein
VRTSAAALDLHQPGIAADFAILDEAAGDILLDDELRGLAAVWTGDEDGHNRKIIRRFTPDRAASVASESPPPPV